MNKQTINFAVNEQELTLISGVFEYASDTVDYIEAQFDLGDNWEFDIIKAVWKSGSQQIATLLNGGVCIVPTEVLTEVGKVSVNLVGSDVEEVVVDRLTTNPIVALLVTKKALLDGNETTELTPSQFEQYVEMVKISYRDDGGGNIVITNGMEENNG